MSKLKSAAILTIKDAKNMSKDGKRRIASWLERQVRFFRKNSKKMSTHFTARYTYSD